MTDKIIDEHFQATIKNITVVFDNQVIFATDFGQFIKNNYDNKDISYWENLCKTSLAKMQQDKTPIHELPKQESEEFITSMKIMKSFQSILNQLEFLTVNPKHFYQNYLDCQKPEFLAAKKAFIENIPMLFEKSKSQPHLDFQTTLFSIKEIKTYLSSFIFDMQNKHSGKYEKIVSKKIHFETNYKKCKDGIIFRFMDCVTEAFQHIIYDANGQITNSEAIAQKFFLPHIWNGCGYCQDTNPVTFNHLTGKIEEIYAEQCSLAEEDKTRQFSTIKTTGKLLFCNDIRLFASNPEFSSLISEYSNKHKISTYLNTWEGQQGYMIAYANLFNCAYFQGGNHAAYLHKSKKGFKLSLQDKAEKSLHSISLETWSANVIDYESAIILAGSETLLLEKLKQIDHFIMKTKPGIYQAISYSDVDSYKPSKKDVTFGELIFIEA